MNNLRGTFLAKYRVCTAKKAFLQNGREIALGSVAITVILAK
jgi:hypothetical protein